jgi:hypothetical protein
MEGRSLLTGVPALREAETGASGRRPGTPVQRPAAIPPGDGICAAHVTAPSLARIRDTAISAAAGATATESGGIFA